MFNMLIADDNLIFSKNLVNIILKHHDRIRLTSITTDGKETLEILLKEKIDILLLDLKMPKYTGLEIIEKLNTLLDSNCIPYIIAMFGDTQYLSRLINFNANMRIYGFLSKESSNFYTRLNDILFEITHDDKKLVFNKEKILSELCSNIGFNIKHIGTTYITESIIYIYNSKESDLINNLEKNVYLPIAKNHNTSIHNVKSNISKSIDSMYRFANIENLKKYFYFQDNMKPTPKIIIQTVLHKLFYNNQYQKLDSYNTVESKL